MKRYKVFYAHEDGRLETGSLYAPDLDVAKSIGNTSISGANCIYVQEPLEGGSYRRVVAMSVFRPGGLVTVSLLDCTNYKNFMKVKGPAREIVEQYLGTGELESIALDIDAGIIRIRIKS